MEALAVGVAGGVRIYDGSHLLELATPSPAVVSYGVGCGAAAPQLSADAWPRTAVPEFALSTIGHAPNALLAFVLADQPASVPLGACTLLVQPGGATALNATTGAGFGSLSVPLPAAATLVGQDFYCQAFSLSSAGLAATAGLQLTIGR